MQFESLNEVSDQLQQQIAALNNQLDSQKQLKKTLEQTHAAKSKVRDALKEQLASGQRELALHRLSELAASVEGKQKYIDSIQNEVNQIKSQISQIKNDKTKFK